MRLMKGFVTSVLSASIVCSPLLALGRGSEVLTVSERLALIEKRRLQNEKIVDAEAALAKMQQKLLALNTILRTAEKREYAKAVALDDVSNPASLTIGLLFVEIAALVLGPTASQIGEKYYNIVQLEKYEHLRGIAYKLAYDAHQILSSPYYLTFGFGRFMERIEDQSKIPQAMQDMKALLALEQYKPSEIRKAVAVFVYNADDIKGGWNILRHGLEETRGWKSENTLAKAVTSYRRSMTTIRAGGALAAVGSIAAGAATVSSYMDQTAAIDAETISENPSLTVAQAKTEMDQLFRSSLKEELEKKIEAYVLQTVSLSTQIILERNNIEKMRQNK